MPGVLWNRADPHQPEVSEDVPALPGHEGGTEVSECLHIHDEDGHDVGYVCRPGPMKYQAALHERGARKWEPIGKPTTIDGAFRRIGEALRDDKKRSWRKYNRAGIWAVERGYSYYDPLQVYEVTVL